MKAAVWVLGLSLVVSLAAMGWGQEPAPPAPTATPGSAARIQFDAMNYSFGKVRQGTTAVHDFVFTNIGTEELKILSSRAGCGCTLVKSSTSAAPGATGVIGVSFNTGGYVGLKRKTVTVDTNDPTKPNLVLTFEADVYEELSVSPQSLALGVVAENSTAAGTIALVGGKDIKLNINEATSSNDWLAASFTPPATSADSLDVEKSVLNITMTHPMPKGLHNGAVLVKTGHQGKEVINIPVTVSVVGPMKVDPAELNLGEVTAGKPATGEVAIMDYDQAIKLGDPVVTLPGSTVERSVRYEGNRAIIGVTVTAQPGAETLTGTLEIRSNHPTQNTLQIPVHGKVKK